MWSAWGIDEGLIFAVSQKTFSLLGPGPYPIGLTAPAPFNVPLPSRIYMAFIVSGTNRNELRIVDAATYFSHNDLTASSSVPDELYPDFNVLSATGLATLSLYPVPTGTPNLELIVGATFNTWVLTTNYNVPQGFDDLLGWALAFRLISSFGAAVSQNIVEMVTAIGSKAEARIREMNVKNRQLPQPAAASPEQQLTAAVPKQ